MSHRLTVEDLNVSNQYCPNQIDLTEWPHLEGMDQPNIDVEVSEVSVLIGQDVPQAHVVLHYCWCDNPQSQPYALTTPFGLSVPTAATALSIFDLTLVEIALTWFYTRRLSSSGLQKNMDLLENVMKLLKIEKPLKVLNARLPL